MTHWFGQSWGAPACEPEDHIPVPVGSLCLQCKEPILVHDQGVTMPLVSLEGEEYVTRSLAYHLDCWLKHILPHGPDCPRCRGLERGEHEERCAYRSEGGECDCVAGEVAP